jgi:hypothetical protein
MKYVIKGEDGHDLIIPSIYVLQAKVKVTVKLSLCLIN